jgi:hypothetical protein
LKKIIIMHLPDRRRFILTSAFGVFSLSAVALTSSGNKKNKMLIHHVFFWLKNPGSVADRDRLIQGLQTLKKIPSIKDLHIGLPAETEKRDVVDASYSVSELLFFESLEKQKLYQDHPIHKKFIEDCSGLWQRVVVYDAMDI